MANAVVFLIFWAVVSPAFCAAPVNSAQDTAAVLKMVEPPRHEIPFKRDEAVTTSGVVRVVISLIAVLALALASVFLMKRYFPGYGVTGGGQSQRITVVEVKRLTPKTLLFLLEVDGKTLLLAQSSDKVTALTAGETAPPHPELPSRGE